MFETEGTTEIKTNQDQKTGMFEHNRNYKNKLLGSNGALGFK